MEKQFNVIIEKDSDGYFVGSVPSIKGCYTQAKSLDELMVRIKEVIELCLDSDDMPTFNEFVGVQRLAISI